MLRIVTKVVSALLLLAIAAASFGYWYLRRSLPAMDGMVTVAGLTEPVEIVRDQDAIPHVFAKTKADAFFGLGYVHAQDRLWQMEFQRRIANGRLSEIFGEVTIPQDRFLRTVGFGRAARSAWERLPETARIQIDAYVAGVNAFISSHRGSQLPPEFTLLRYTPEPWSGVDVMGWVKMMAWDLSANYSQELMRHDLLARVGEARAADLLQPYAPDGLDILPAQSGQQPSRPVGDTSAPPLEHQPNLRIRSRGSAWAQSVEEGLSRGHAAVANLLRGGGVKEALGSNNWVVDGTLTTTGAPMLANDPHLGTHIPSLWYLAHIVWPDGDLIGATLPGTPAVAIGRNRHIAWGETNVAADVEDLYLERLDTTGTRAEFQGVYEPLRMITETIAVKGGQPITVNVRISRHGPLISDALNANNAAAPEPKPAELDPLAFRWTALDDEDNTVVAFLLMNEAKNWDEFIAAMRHFVVPAQNFVYADVDGHIGYFLPGRIPIRASGDGSLPIEGWSGNTEWTGWIPFDALPHVFDPADHAIITANNRQAADYPYLLTLEYPEPYRAQRITELIARGTKLSPDDFRAIQADTVSLHAKTLLPLLLQHAQPTDEIDKEAVSTLQRWDFDARPDSAASAIFQAWFLELAPALAGDELGVEALRSYRGRFSYITRFVIRTLSTPGSPWCDDVTTGEQETCQQMVTKALHQGVAQLAQPLGNNISRWRWDSVHRAVFPHQGLDIAPLRPILGRSVPNGGDWSTVNVGAVSASQPFNQTEVPGYRQIVDLSPANDSRYLDAVGQSGHFLSPHYADSLPDWQAVRHKKMRMDRADIERGAIGTLRLGPR